MAPVRDEKSATQTTAPDTPVTSRDNQWLKRFRAALTGERDDDLVGVEGVRLVEAALGSGLSVEALLVSDSGDRHMARIHSSLQPGLKILRTTDRLFEGVADTKSPQGIAALVRPRQATFENLLPANALVVVLVGVQDPGNVGTIVRAAEAFGATGVAICPAGAIGTSDPLGPKAVRASAGSVFRLPVVHGFAADALLAKFHDSGVKSYASVAEVQDANAQDSGLRASNSAKPLLKPWEIDWNLPSALLIGNEGAGLPNDIVQASDARVSIPQAAGTTAVGLESLNAAMAATILMYEARRQRILK